MPMTVQRLLGGCMPNLVQICWKLWPLSENR